MAENSNTDEDQSKITSMSSKELHDQWLAQKPEDAKHDSDCPFCQEAKQNPTGGAGVSMSDKTHTAEELAAAVALATKPLEDKIRDLEAKGADDEVASKIAEAVKPVEDKLTEVQNELDVKTAEAAAAKQEIEDVKAYLKSESDSADEAKAVAERKDERIAKVKEVADFTDEYVTEKADRWAEMSEEDFDALVETIKTAAPKKEKAGDEEIPDKTKLSGVSEKANQGGGDESHLGSLLDLQRARIDARRL